VDTDPPSSDFGAASGFGLLQNEEMERRIANQREILRAEEETEKKFVLR